MRDYRVEGKRRGLRGGGWNGDSREIGRKEERAKLNKVRFNAVREKSLGNMYVARTAFESNEDSGRRTVSLQRVLADCLYT